MFPSLPATERASLAPPSMDGHLTRPLNTLYCFCIARLNCSLTKCLTVAWAPRLYPWVESKS